MLIVSDRALTVMANALDAGELAEEQVLRLAMGADGEYGLVIDEARDGDEIISRDERPVLYIGSEASPLLHGATLDVADGMNSVRFALKMPEPGL